MKVAISCDEYCARVGDNFYLREFGQILVNRYLMVFDEVRLIVRTFDCVDINECGKFNKLVQDSRIEIYPITFFQGPKEYLLKKFNIVKLIRKSLYGCDVAIFRLPSAIGFAIWSYALKNNVPYAVELVYDCMDGYKQSSGLSKLLWWRMHHKQIDACKHAIGIAPVTTKYLQSHYEPTEDNIIKSHYSSVEITDDFFYKSRQYPIKDSLTLVHVANQVQFRGRKGHEDVISAVRLLKDIGININIIFVGEDYKNGIEKLMSYASSLDIADRVSFTGFVSSKRMREILLSSDIAILPTRAEGLPRVVIEAMTLGLPCITTNVSGNSELIDSEFLFSYGDVNAIVQLIKKLVDDRELYEITSTRNFNKSHEFSKDALDTRRKEFYSAIRNKINHLKTN